MGRFSKFVTGLVDALAVLGIVFACVMTVRTVHKKSGHDWHIVVLP
jgi:hypothetical protein